MMKRFVQKVFLVVAVLAFAVSAKAQQRAIVTVDEPATSYYAVGKAEVSYFAGSNTTEVRIQLPSHHVDGDAASLWFVSTFAGKDIVTPKELFVGIGVRRDKAKLEKLDGFVLEADEVPLKLANRTIEGLTYELNDEHWARAMGAMLGFAEFQKLVTSNTARLRIAEVAFVLDKESREALRDMFQALTEPRPKS